MWDIVITIVMLIVLLLVLIGFHEAGHFAVAKLCNVYCAEFSIGFGPKLFSLKRKKGETAFTVRALPLGGYVSMYGEEGELEGEEATKIPKERSLEGVGKLKKCAILLAGVFVNFLLTFVFCYAYALCFPDYSIIAAPSTTPELSYQGGYLTRTYFKGIEGGLVETKTPVGVLTLEQDANGQYYVEGEDFPFYAGIALSQPPEPDIAQVGGYIFDTETTINGEDYVTLFLASTLTGESDLTDSLVFYPAISLGEARERKSEYVAGSHGAIPDMLTLSDEELSLVGITSYPDLRQGPYVLENGDEVAFHINTLSRSEVEDFEGNVAFVLDTSTLVRHEVSLTAVPMGEEFVLSGSGLTLKPLEVWYSFSERMGNGTNLWCNLWANMGAGLYAIFTGNIGSLSGPIGIGAALGSIAQTSGWAYSFFYLGALVSLNLAIINLFPFPGLDGWQLVTTAYEAVTRRKIKEKTKNIVSYIGLGLLLVLAVYIMVMDVLRLV